MLRGNFIAGEEVIDSARPVFERRSPADERETLVVHALADHHDVTLAVDAGRDAAGAWARLPGPRRGEILHRAASLLEADAEAAAVEIAEHAGKTLADAQAEVFRTGTLLRFFAEQARAADGEIGDAEETGTTIFTRRQPLGLVALITPWNFPLAIPARKLAPSLAFGNTAILKPSPLAAAPALRLAELLRASGLPSGCLSVLVGEAELGQALTEHPGVNGVSFTGSTAVGRFLVERLASRIPVQAEMGGHNPVIVLRDADPRHAAEVIARGAFAAAGQTCTATRRVIIESDARPAVLRELIEVARHLRLGPGIETETNVPPLIASERREAVEHEIATAVREGASKVHGGSRPDGRLAHGAFLLPTILDEVTPEMRIATHEVFGPVVSILAVDDYDQAVDLANSGSYGLSSAIITNDLRRAMAFAASATSGMVHINRPTVGSDPQMPFGGTRSSGHGPAEQGTAARLFYTHNKTVYLHSS